MSHANPDDPIFLPGNAAQFGFGQYFRLERGEYVLKNGREEVVTVRYTVPTITMAHRRLLPYRILQRGGYGVLVRYRDAEDSTRQYAVKIEDTRVSARGEHPVLGQLLGVNCGQIHGRPVGFARYSKNGQTHDGAFSLLELMDGDFRHKSVLQEYAAFHGLESQSEAALYVTEAVRQQVVCMFRHDPSLVYADLKAANVMFQRLETGEIRVRLGDLGSMMSRRGEYAMSFPCPPDFAKRKFDTPDEAASCLAYQVGMLLASLLGVPKLNYLGYARVEGSRRATRGRRLVPKLHETVRGYLAQVLPNHDPTVADLLLLDPAMRRSVFRPLIDIEPAWLLADDAADAA